MSDTSSSSDEDDTYLAAVASVAVTGASICAQAAESAKAASQKLKPRFAGAGPEPAGAVAPPGNVPDSSATYLSLADDLHDEVKPLQGPLAEKLTQQLHSLLDRTIGASIRADRHAAPSPEGMAQEVRGKNQTSNSLGNTLADTGVRMFKKVAHGTPCILASQTARKPPRHHTSWCTALKGKSGDESDDEKEVMRAAWTVAIDPEDLLLAAATAADEALGQVVVVEEVDSDTDWRGGVKPGSSIARRQKAKKAKDGARESVGVGTGDGAGVASAKTKKRKGKKERQREQQRMSTDTGAAEGASAPGQPPPEVSATAASDAEKLQRKRAKRRELKKKRRLAGK